MGLAAGREPTCWSAITKSNRRPQNVKLALPQAKENRTATTQDYVKITQCVGHVASSSDHWIVNGDVTVTRCPPHPDQFKITVSDTSACILGLKLRADVSLSAILDALSPPQVWGYTGPRSESARLPAHTPATVTQRRMAATRSDLTLAPGPRYRPTGETEPTMIATFGNSTITIRAKFSKNSDHE